MKRITVQATNVRPGTTGAGGWDCDVEVEIDGIALPDGELTLLPRRFDGRPGAWGTAANWISGALLSAIEQRFELRLTRREIRDHIEAAARKAIEASSVSAASDEVSE